MPPDREPRAGDLRYNQETHQVERCDQEHLGGRLHSYWETADFESAVVWLLAEILRRLPAPAEERS